MKKEVLVTDKTKIGRLIAWGGEHFVYEYDADRVIKFSTLYFFLGPKAKEKATQDYNTCKDFFGKYILETEIAFSSNNKYIVHIQPKIAGHFLTKKDLEQAYIQKQFKEIVNDYHSMIKTKNAEIDLIGRAGVFRGCLSNIFVTSNNELLIIDATLMEVIGFLKPIVFLIRTFVIWRQNSTIKYFLSQDNGIRHPFSLMLSAWGFAIVFASLLFLYIGHFLDEWLGTEPNFMLGLFFLAIVTSIGRLYQEAWLRRKDV